MQSALVRFVGLLYELGLSPRREQVLAVKIEVSTRPPAGATLAVTTVRRHELMMRLQHHDRASLFAGKLHAVLQRPYPKGRDIFDLAWYLSDPDWPEPNLRLLNHALKQTAPRRRPLTQRNWRAAVVRKIRTLDFDEVLRDVDPFLEASVDRRLLGGKRLLELLQARTSK